jgi:thiamine biosynthesis protein ThiI
MAEHLLIVTPSPELHLKSHRTRAWMSRRLRDNLCEALQARAPGARLVDDGRTLSVRCPDVEAAVDALTTTFGVQRVSRVQELAFTSLDDLAAVVADAAAERVAGRTFAVRVRRRTSQPWGSMDAEAAIGRQLLGGSAGVDLRTPETEVRVEAYATQAFLVERTVPGPSGLPLGTQDRALSLLSGGYDSAVAAWMAMRRGVAVDFVHFRLDCGVADHAVVTAYELWRRWGAGTSPRWSVVDFQQVKDALEASAPRRVRQVVLKSLMIEAASLVASEGGASVLVTGEAIGQVSSQTLANLVSLDALADKLVLRPLIAMDKDEIIGWSRRVGLEDLGRQAREVCDLSGPRVSVAMTPDALGRTRAALPRDLVEKAVASREVITLKEWEPGMPGAVGPMP